MYTGVCVWGGGGGGVQNFDVTFLLLEYTMGIFGLFFIFVPIGDSSPLERW